MFPNFRNLIESVLNVWKCVTSNGGYLEYSRIKVTFPNIGEIFQVTKLLNKKPREYKNNLIF